MYNAEVYIKIFLFWAAGDMKLVICDTERKVMRVYKGTSMLVENQLLDTPVSDESHG
jgi:hypothetical protein